MSSDTVIGNDGVEVLTCSCCGTGVRDTPEDNVSHGEVPYPHDTGFGLCLPCGGNKNSKSIKKRLGWAGRTFYEARFAVLAANLNEKNRANFEGLSYDRKVAVIAKLVEAGHMF